MIATTHVIVGGAVGTLTGNPALGFLAGVTSHLVCDSLPHLDAPFEMQYENGQFDRLIWSKKIFLWAIIDSLIALLISLYVWFRLDHFALSSAFAWGALGAYLPDLIDVAPWWRDAIRTVSPFKQFHALHLATHDLWRHKFPMPRYWILGTFTQIIAIVIAIYIFLKT